ncbi:hypothetical protein CROQUDRAFT_652885 [Cronartium quercuum f. sp. fusiforme G11]|uniref:Uncharacterized protein n=1 Tax=Cronartium quercuum f. sp. fusiforme G11 TaxID=708437 RepID=A0A9P6TFN5_9BASI|nr:hypothetical protein CROQUDRAFT_652885 [Cronartium quercuum f. sp. fusiforme G11]
MSDGLSATISNFFGTLSQLAWLFAQLPQIWENHRSHSVAGLSFPFLLSWLLGDVTNLIGCLLTHQLPFQRNLAIYFTFVDLVLMYQFFRFSKNDHADYQALGHHDSGRSLEDETPEERWRRHLRQVSAAQLDSPGGLAREYTRSMSRLRRKRQTSTQTAGVGGGTDASFISSRSDQTPSQADRVVKSPTHDERGRSLARSNPARLAPLRTSSLAQMPNPSRRSVSDATVLTSSTRSPQPLATSRFSTLPFLGLFAFLVFNVANIPSSEGNGQFSRAWDSASSVTSMSKSVSTSFFPPDQLHHRRSLSTSEQHPVDWQKLIGRTSAWLCAILYLTSRLPQIWKNFCRKSVEGLSILLFVMAFLGNLTYVISVLLSPEMAHEPGYLAESFPYLIGSGGTLCFDFTIFVQSRLYPSDQRLQRRRRRTTSAGRSREVDIERQPELFSPISPPSHLSFSTSSRSGTRAESTEMEQPLPPHEPRTAFPFLAAQSETPEVVPHRHLVDSPVDT